MGFHHLMTMHHVFCGLTPPSSCQFWLRFWSRQMQKPHGLTAILVPDSTIREAEAPSYHKQQRQVGVHRLVAMHHVVCGLAPP